MTKFVSPFKDGATVQVAYGVLRGVGPMGPRGLTGPAGPAGPQGVPGPQAEMKPVTGQYNTSAATVITANATWVKINLSTTVFAVGSIGTVNAQGGITMQGVGDTGIAAVISPQVTMISSTGVLTAFNFEVGLFLGTSGTPFASSTFRHDQGVTANTYSFTAQMLVPENAEVYLKVRTWATSAPQVTAAVVSLSRAGGPKGDLGPIGPTGAVGATGPQGIAGNSGTGYGTMDALDSAGDSDVLPTGSQNTLQGIPYPLGTMAPALPAYLKNTANAVSKWIVRRFTNSADVLAASDVAPGQVAYVSATASFHGVSQIGGVNKLNYIAQVIWGPTDPPTTGVYPAGTIYLKVV